MEMLRRIVLLASQIDSFQRGIKAIPLIEILYLPCEW